MFTVVLAEKAFIDECANNYNLFLQPFFEKDDFKISEWNPAGKTISEMLPDLYDTVGKRTEWRAIVVAPFDNGTSFDVKKKNPFDVTKYVDVPVEENISFCEEEKIEVPDYASRTELRRISYNSALDSPLTRIGLCLSREHWLDLSALSYEQEKSRIEQTIKNLLSPENDNNEDLNIAKEIIDIHESIEYLEFLRERDIKRELIAKFIDENIPERHLLLPAPLELYFLSPRKFDSVNYDIALSAELGEEEEYSRFAQFNMYPPSARFIVYDMHENEHSQYEYDFVCFLEFLFTFATNDMPQSKMRPERLYRAICDNNFNLLNEFLLRYEKKLALTEMILKKQYDELTEDNREVLPDDVINSRYCSDININIPTVVLPKNMNFNLRLASFGLFGNYDSDISRLKRFGEEIQVKLNELRKNNYRAILAQCEQTRSKLGDFGEMTDKLTKLQEKDVIDFALERENTMMSMPRMETIDSTHNTDEIYKAEAEVARVLRQRMSFKKFMFAMAYAAVAFLLGYIIYLTNRNPYASYPFSNIVFMLLSFGTVVLAAVIAVMALRRKLKKAFAHYHYTVMLHVNKSKSFVDTYSLLLSRICEIVRSHMVVAFAKSGENQRTARAYIIKKHILDIIAARDVAADIFGKFKVQNVDTYIYDTIEPYEFDFSKPTTYKYELPFAESDIRKIKFMGSELAGEIPIGFISEIDVVREEVR